MKGDHKKSTAVARWCLLELGIHMLPDFHSEYHFSRLAALHRVLMPLSLEMKPTPSFDHTIFIYAANFPIHSWKQIKTPCCSFSRGSRNALEWHIHIISHALFRNVFLAVYILHTVRGCSSMLRNQPKYFHIINTPTLDSTFAQGRWERSTRLSDVHVCTACTSIARGLSRPICASLQDNSCLENAHWAQSGSRYWRYGHTTHPCWPSSRRRFHCGARIDLLRLVYLYVFRVTQFLFEVGDEKARGNFV